MVDTCWRKTREGIELFCVAKPGAAKNALDGIVEGRLRLKLAAPPAEGKANRELTRFLARRLGVAPGAVEIVQGRSARHKRVAVAGDPEILAQTMVSWLESSSP